MDFMIDNVKSFFAAMMYIRMFGVLTHTFITRAGSVVRAYVFGEYTMFIYNDGSGLGMRFSIHGPDDIVYRYYAITDKDLIKVLGLPDDKFIIEGVL